jgi:hypothetical protein
MKTSNGSATIRNLKAGNLVVDFRKSGYIGQQQTAVISADSETSISAKLEPDTQTQAQFGKQLLDGMQQALGGDAIHKDLASVSAAGSASFYDTAGAGSEWNLTVALRPDQATLEAKNAAGGLKLECRGEVCQPNTGKKLFLKSLSRERAQFVETELRQFRLWHFSALIDRLLSDKFRPSAKTADVPSAEDQMLRLESVSEVFTVTLDPRFHPSLVMYEPKSGLGRLTLAFSDFGALGKSQYPKTTEIKLLDGKQGLRARLEPQIALSPK